MIYRIVIGVIVFIYIISPVDIHTGPLDDILIAIVGYITQKGIAKKHK